MQISCIIALWVNSDFVEANATVQLMQAVSQMPPYFMFNVVQTQAYSFLCYSGFAELQHSVEFTGDGRPRHITIVYVLR